MPFEPEQRTRGRFVPDAASDSSVIASSPEAKSLAEQIPVGETDREAARLAAQTPPERRVQPISPVQGALQAMSAIPILGGGARVAQMLSAGGRLAPYAKRAAEVLIPKTGKELVGRAALTGAGGAAAQAVSNVLPEDTAPYKRELAEMGTAMAVEGVGGAARTAGRAIRPILPGGPGRAGERVVRELQPEVLETLPALTESRKSIVRQAMERLRGKPIESEVDVGEVARILGTDAALTRQRGGELASRLTAETERRLADISRPKTATEVGESARDLVTKRLDKLKADREKVVEKDKLAAFGAAQKAEVAGRRISDTDAFKRAEQQLAAMKIDPQTKLPLTTGETGTQIDLVRRELTGITMDPMTGQTRKTGVSFQKLEDLRRFLGDRASGMTNTGYDAIKPQQAASLKELVEDVMKEFTGGKLNTATGRIEGGSFEKYLANYRKASEPINQFQTTVGQKLTGMAEAPRGTYATDPMALPKAIFSSPSNVDDFIRLTGGDKKSVEALARNFVSEQTANMSSAQIKGFLNTNRNWLAKFPQVRDDFAKYADRLVREGDVQKRLATRTEERAARFELGRDPAEQGRRFRDLLTGTGNEADVAAAGRVLGKTPEGQQAFKTAVREIIGTTPPGGLEARYRDRIRPALQASGLYKPDEIGFLDDSIRDIVSVEVAVQRAMSRASQIPGAESNASMLTRLINEEVAQMKKGGVMMGGIVSTLLGGLRYLDVPTPSMTQLGLGAGVAGALAKNSYLQYNNNIRAAVNDIVTDPERLRQVLAVPPAQREGVIARLLRQAVGTAVGVQAPEGEENATQAR